MSEGDRPEGMPPTEALVLHDPGAEKSLVILLFEDDDAYQRAHQILDAMPAERHTGGSGLGREVRRRAPLQGLTNGRTRWLSTSFPPKPRTSEAWDFTDLRALFINCTLKPSPEVSHTQGLIEISIAIMEANGVAVDEVRAVDHDIATGRLAGHERARLPRATTGPRCTSG